MDYEAWARENCTVCPGCWKAEQDAKAVAGLDLPELTGTVKQVAWAEKIRVKLIGNAREDASHMDGPQNVIAMDYIRFITGEKTDSRFWIDNREKDLFRLPECREFVRSRGA